MAPNCGYPALNIRCSGSILSESVALPPRNNQGEIVSERIVKIDDIDNVVSLREKLEAHIPEMITDLFKFIDQEKKGILVESGVYRPRISEKDYTIDPASDSERIIKKKIKSQETYDGAILHSKNGIIRVKSWEAYLSLLE